MTYKINLNTLTGNTSENSIIIPIDIKFNPMDRMEVIQNQFIPQEVAKSINPTIDYEKVRFIPVDSSNGVQNILNYNVCLSGGTGAITTYDYAGFTDEDLKFRKNNLRNTYLRLAFYDSDVSTTQELLSIITLYPRIQNPNQPIAQVPTRFTLTNPDIYPNTFSEGFYIYSFKSEVNIYGLRKELYMKAEFRNAKTGVATKLATTFGYLDINNFNQYSYIKYILRRTADGYYYEIDVNYPVNSPYSTNVIYGANNSTVDINLYKMVIN